MSVDVLVDSIHLYRLKPIWAHGYVGPFFLLYALWIGVFIQYFGFEEYNELFYIGIGVTAVLQALAILFCQWIVSIKCLMTCSAAVNVEHAEYAQVVPTQNNGHPELVPLQRKKFMGIKKLWFEFQKVQYMFDEEERKFRTIEFDSKRPLKFYQKAGGFQSEDELSETRFNLGDNRMEMFVPQFWDQFKERATAPFFVFQVFCVGLWCLEDMWYYSLFTLLMLMTFEASLVKQQMRNMSEIRNMGNKSYLIYAYRFNRWNRIRTEELVPGDIVSITRGADDQTVPCDVLLLRGSCIVDESLLTGESVPQMKESIENGEAHRHLDIDVDSRLHLINGGTKIVQVSPPAKQESGMKTPDNGCVCYVLRTGFHTNQGRLLRTIMFGVRRVTANNYETFCFILFLLIFAIAASSYLWVVGSADERRNKYKLFLECTLILTSVIPPELPIELSLAVNTSLMALQKFGVFCTEPFRIPFAGKIDVCCFDKTGTLTTDNLIVEGVVTSQDKENGLARTAVDAQENSIQVLACCHSLARYEEELVGDPLEKACLSWVDWTLTKGDTVVPRKAKMHSLKIHRRFYFSSALKRMTVVAGYQKPGFAEAHYLACVKGAPETLRDMFSDRPSDYDKLYERLALQGARVLALGVRELGPLTTQQIRDANREQFEQELNFAGFVVISCPLKPDTKLMIKEIIESSHQVAMITGDNPLTACHVAQTLRFTKKKGRVLILDEPQGEEQEWSFVAIDSDEENTPGRTRVSVKQVSEFKTKEWKEFITLHDFCLTGVGWNYLVEQHPTLLPRLLVYIKIFSRMAPKQKEHIINEFKRLGKITLMCGDGTNDVGALKHADVGVALLSHPFDAIKAEKKEQEERERKEKEQEEKVANSIAPAPSKRAELIKQQQQRAKQTHPSVTTAQKKLETMMKELEEEEKAQVVRLGDASIAAPFTSKYTSIQSICHVIKQGRCTLVTTLQMFKILALNALISAYSLSVLYLDGVKFSDTQATIQGLLLAACFLFVSRSKPLRTLSRQRPLSNIFNAYTLLTVTSQFALHFSVLIYIVGLAHEVEPRKEKIDLEATFSPNILNSTVYVISMALQVCTFAVNYRGRPFMESLFENKAMLYSIMFSGGAVMALAFGASDDMVTQFELVKLPLHLRDQLVLCVLSDLIGCFLIDRTLNYFLGDMF
ncbi:unnamed protein product, partial [Mesorhabditis belari]|uniref:Cation-transporting ATPase 13A1 n=1 Tax=Mesorhabditis belari TaxID=2138241 RepID=A0AAF3FH02_9BILA